MPVPSILVYRVVDFDRWIRYEGTSKEEALAVANEFLYSTIEVRYGPYTPASPNYGECRFQGYLER